jgi:dihydroxyacetone kinase-like predicted kinase
VETLDAAAVRRWAGTATSALGAARAQIDAVNVFPVPDSDTGTNVYLTVARGAQLVSRCPVGSTAAEVAAAFAHGALLGARGNSGVILSQYLDGLAGCLDEGTPRQIAVALDAAQVAARAAVARPVEGTVLTAATSAARHAVAAADRGADLSTVLGDAVEGARESANRSRHELPALRAAGVVDAGAWALVVLLEALLCVVNGVDPAPGAGVEPFDRTSIGAEDIAEAAGPAEAAMLSSAADAASAGEFEVMFLVERAVAGTGTEDLGPELRARMQDLGDSVAVVGGHGVWQVHVHTDDPAAAVRAGALADQRQITVRCLTSQLPGSVRAATGPGSRTGVGLVVGTRSPALMADLARTGAVVHVLTDGVPSAGEFLRAIEDCGAREVMVLPGDAVAYRVALGAAAASADRDVLVHVLAAVDDVTVVTGLTAAVEHDADEDPAAQLRAVTTAVRSTLTAVVAESDQASACAAVSALLARGRADQPPGAVQVLTVLLGDHVSPAVLQDLLEHVATHHPLVEPVVLRGGFTYAALAVGAQ